MVSVALTVSTPALVTAAVLSRPPVASIKVAGAAMVTSVLLELPVRLRVPPFTASEPPPMVPETKVLPVLVVGPLSVPETVAPSSAALPL